MAKGVSKQLLPIYDRPMMSEPISGLMLSGETGVFPTDYDFEAHKELVPMQSGDVPTTYADASAFERDFGFTPKITLREGLRIFAERYKKYYQ